MDRERVGATTTRHARQTHAIRPRNYRYEERGKFFSNRVVQDYNSLPQSVKQSTDINSFKNSSDKFRGTPSRAVGRPTGSRFISQDRNRGSS